MPCSHIRILDVVGNKCTETVTFDLAIINKWFVNVIEEFQISSFKLDQTNGGTWLHHSNKLYNLTAIFESLL